MGEISGRIINNKKWEAIPMANTKVKASYLVEKFKFMVDQGW
jgi:hypothetical protein